MGSNISFGSITFRYAAFGVALGLAFPAGALVYLVASGALPVGDGIPRAVVTAHRTEPLMLVLWAAPVLLGALAAFAGAREARIRTISVSLEAEVERKTASLREVLAEARHANEMIAHMADHDPLTGLFNRRRLREELNRIVAVARRHHRVAAVLFLDLDDLKRINDAHGHEAGDEALRAASSILREVTRATDFACRWGGDEFAMLLTETTREGACVVAERLVKAFRERRIRVGSSERALSCSAGVAVFPDTAGSADELVAHADAAMYRAKRAGGGAWLLYRGDHAEQGRIAESRRWANRVKQALEGDRFVAVYQPVLRLATGTCQDYEALVRMEDARGVLIESGVFVEAAEECGFGEALDRLVLGKVLRRMASGDGAPDRLTVSVNLFPSTVLDPAFPALLRTSAAEVGADLARLRVEIPDRIAAQNVGPLDVVAKELQRLGCGLVIDDMGAGFLTLVQLRRLGVATVKLHRSLLEHAETDLEARAILRSLIQGLHGIGVEAVAKCVERPSSLPFLVDQGVDLVQGYAIGKPSEVLAPVSRMSLTVGA